MLYSSIVFCDASLSLLFDPQVPDLWLQRVSLTHWPQSGWADFEGAFVHLGVIGGLCGGSLSRGRCPSPPALDVLDPPHPSGFLLMVACNTLRALQTLPSLHIAF
jgi:hypothetical protein